MDGKNCRTLDAAALLSIIRHHIGPSMGPALMAERNVAGMIGWIDCSRADDSEAKLAKRAKVGESCAASCSDMERLLRFMI